MQNLRILQFINPQSWDNGAAALDESQELQRLILSDYRC